MYYISDRDMTFVPLDDVIVSVGDATLPDPAEWNLHSSKVTRTKPYRTDRTVTHRSVETALLMTLRQIIITIWRAGVELLYIYVLVHSLT